MLSGKTRNALAHPIMNSRIRKRILLERADPVSETASCIADGLHDVADAMRMIAGVLAWGAVAENSGNHGRQKEMAAVVLRFASEGYFSAKVDGIKVSQANQEQAEAMFHKLFPMAKGRK